MKFLLSIVLSALLAVVGAAALLHVMPQATESYTQLRAATYRIEGDFGHCSAVMVAPGVLLTAAHCEEEGAKKLSGSNLPIKFLRKDESRDLMLLQVGKGCPCVPITFEQFTQDEPVVQIGYPEASGVQVLTKGNIQGAINLEKQGLKEMVLSTAPASLGSSGGPVFVKRDGEWKVGGLVFGGTMGAYQGMYPYIVTHLVVISTPQSLYNFIFRIQ